MDTQYDDGIFLFVEKKTTLFEKWKKICKRRLDLLKMKNTLYCKDGRWKKKYKRKVTKSKEKKKK